MDGNWLVWSSFGSSQPLTESTTNTLCVTESIVIPGWEYTGGQLMLSRVSGTTPLGC